MLNSRLFPPCYRQSITQKSTYRATNVSALSLQAMGVRVGVNAYKSRTDGNDPGPAELGLPCYTSMLCHTLIRSSRRFRGDCFTLDGDCPDLDRYDGTYTITTYRCLFKDRRTFRSASGSQRKILVTLARYPAWTESESNECRISLSRLLAYWTGRCAGMAGRTYGVCLILITS